MRLFWRWILGGVAAQLAWLWGLRIIFGPVQRLLADPERQSAKFLSAFTQDPLPRMAESWLVLPGGLLLIGLGYSAAYLRITARLGGPTWRRGLRFGGLAWLLLIPWFEFYLPWNVMREPLPLVLLEAACWAALLALVGLALALTNAALDRVGWGP